MADTAASPLQGQHLVPNIWCDGSAEEAGAFYTAAIPGTRVGAVERYPTEGLLDFQQDLAGEALTVDVELPDLRITLINAGDEFRPNPSIGFMLTFSRAQHGDAVGVLDRTHAALMEGGTELMPLGAYPFAPRYAWVQDRYGVSWQLMLAEDAAADAASAPGHGEAPSETEERAGVIREQGAADQDGEAPARPFAVPALMFCGDAQNQCRAAIDQAISVLPDSRWGVVHEYPQQTGPAPAGTIMFSEATLAGQQITAMDSGVEQPFTFTEGVSLMVSAHGQEELDRIWETLSAHPESEQCGWLKDQFGLSWQIVPDNLGELMQREGAYAKLMGMKKIVIDEF